MSLIKQLALVAVLCVAGIAAYRYGWPLVAPADGRQAASSSADGQAAERRRGGNRAATVLVEAVELRAQRTRIEAVGTARAYRSVTLHPAAAGEVAAVRFAPDQIVRRGSVLLELDSRREKLAVDLARVRAENARQLLSRYERSAGSGAYAESTVSDARSDLAEAEIALRQAEVALSERQVIAPFDGFVGLTEIDVGDRIGTGDAIATLDDRASLLVGFSVPELFLGRIGKGHPVEVATWAARDQPISGEIVALDSRIDPVSRSFTARARVANAGDAFRPGMSFAVTLDVHGSRLSPGPGDLRPPWHRRSFRLGGARGCGGAGAGAHRAATGGDGAGRRGARRGRAGRRRGHSAPETGSVRHGRHAPAVLVSVPVFPS